MKRITFQDWLKALLLVGVTLIVYWPALHGGFIWDDDDHLTQNPCIIGPLGFKGIWTSGAAVYYPLVLTSFWCQHALWGLNPLPYHLFTIGMHAGCALLLWRVLRRLRVPGAWLGAVLWALHPVMVESVAWVTELKNTQSCFFYLLAILFFLRWRAEREQSRKAEWFYALALVGAVMAILSKSSTVMLPVVLGLAWWWTDGQWRRGNLLRLAPFFLVSALASGWTIWEQKFHSGALGPEWDQTWMQRFIIAGNAIWFYLGKLLWPHPLIFIYPRWTPDASRVLAFVPGLGAGVALLLLWLKRNGRWKPVYFAAAYFVVSLFPVLGFFNVYFFRYSFVADHFQYLASIGPVALLGAGLALLVRHAERAQARPAALVCAGLLPVLFGLLSWRQAGMYATTETLWRTTLDRNPDCWLAHNHLGNDLFDKGELDQAMVHFQAALKLHPDDAMSCFSLGNALREKGELDGAIHWLRKGLSVQPANPQAHNMLGVLLLHQGLVDEAITHFHNALAMAPDDAQAHSNLGNALTQTGRADEAADHLRKALELRPAFAEAHFNLGFVLSASGQLEQAIQEFEKALALQPRDAAARVQLGMVLVKKGMTREAAMQFETAWSLQPGDADTCRNLAWVLATCPDAAIRNGARAVELAEKANQLSGGADLRFLGTLAAAYAESGRFTNAVAVGEQALEFALAQSNAPAAQAITRRIGLYRAGEPFRDPSQTNAAAQTR